MVTSTSHYVWSRSPKGYQYEMCFEDADGKWTVEAYSLSVDMARGCERKKIRRIMISLNGRRGNSRRTRSELERVTHP